MLRGTRTSRGAASSAAGERRGCPASLLLIRVARPGRRPGATAEIPPGGQSSRWSTLWSTWSQLQGRQPNRGPTLWQLGMQRALLKLFQVVRSSNGLIIGLDFPWVAGPAVGLCCGPPGNGNLAGSPASPRFYAEAAHLRQAILLSRHSGRSVVRWPRLPWSAGAAAGRSRPPGIVQLRPSSSRGSPRWRSLRVVGPQQTTRGHSGSSGGQLSCGTQCATQERQAASPAVGLRGGGLSEWQAPPLAWRGRSESLDGQSGRGHEAGRWGTDSAKLRRSGAAVGQVDGPCPAGPHQSDSELEHPPGRVDRETSALPVSLSRITDAAGPGRRSRYSGG